MGRFLFLVLALVALASPARADDISAAGRSVVRVVVVAFGEDGEVTDFGHGSGFAVAPGRIVTNAHVVAMAQERDRVGIGVVPSEGERGYRAHIVAIDPARDLALLQLDEGTLPPIPLYVGPLDDGTPVAALGYPGNVDLATARSAQDYIHPLPPTRSVGIFSNVRPINGITLLLHTANIARGHSGGPLLDQCGRVLGVNTLITHNQEGDSSFAFSVAITEVVAFLREARQPFLSVSSECVSMSDRLRQDEERGAAEERTRAAAAAAAAEQGRQAQALSLAQIEESRETRLGVAVLLLVLSLIAFGGGGILLMKDKAKPARALGIAGAVLLVGAVLAFLSRPSIAAAEAGGNTSAAATPSTIAPSRFAGHNLCRLVPDRSRVTVSSTGDVPFDWSETGCVNQRTQYARNGDVWTRILVPNGEQAVSVLAFSPGSGEYVVTRYLLDGEAMTRVRAARRGVDIKACTSDTEGRTVLADQQREIGAILPHLPNERLVYACEHQGDAPAAAPPAATP